MCNGSVEQPIKLQRGVLLLYDADTLHRVAPVTRGSRLAVVGWVNSRIKLAQQREILFDLHQSLRIVAGDEDRRDLQLKLAHCRERLLRLWSDA